MTVRRLFAEMDVDEFIYWQTFYHLEPWGFDIENWRSGMIASTVANANRPPRQAPYKIAQFIPKREKPQTPEEMLAALKARWGGG